MTTAIIRASKEVPDSKKLVFAHTAQTYANKPIEIANVGVVIPLNDAAANAYNTFLLGGEFECGIDTGVTVTKGDRLWYNTATDLVTNVKPAAGFFFGRAKLDGSAEAGFVVMEFINVAFFSAGYLGAGDRPVRLPVLAGTCTLFSGSGVLESVVATGAVVGDEVQLDIKTAGANKPYLVQAYVSAADTIQATFSCAAGSGMVAWWKIYRTVS